MNETEALAVVRSLANGVDPSNIATAAVATSPESDLTRLSPRTNRYGIHLLKCRQASMSGLTMNSRSWDTGSLDCRRIKPGWT